MNNPQRKLITSITKTYPTIVKVIRFNVSFSIEIEGKNPHTMTSLNRDKPEYQQELIERADRRAYTNIQDLMLSNNFDHFITLTFDPKINRDVFDVSVCKMKAHRWFESQRKKYGRFGYILVAERHKSGAIHFHGVFQGFKGRLAPRADFDPEKPAYNVSGWSYGEITLALPIKQTEDDKLRVANYVAKYVSKELVRFAGGKRFWVSQDLKRPTKTYNDPELQNPTSEIYSAT